MGEICCELCSHLCATFCRPRNLCLLCVGPFAGICTVILLALFFVIRIVRVTCCCCLASRRWLRVGAWYASEGDFLSVLVALEAVDLLWRKSFVTADWVTLSVWEKLLWQGLTLQT